MERQENLKESLQPEKVSEERKNRLCYTDGEVTVSLVFSMKETSLEECLVTGLRRW